MALSDLLVALKDNAKLYITLTNDTEGNLITFNAGGYEAVESDLGERVVKSISIVNLNGITIDLEDAEP